MADQAEEHERNNPPPPPPDKPKQKYDYRVPAVTRCEETFRHSHWRCRRERVAACLASAGASTFALDRFKNCGSGCVVEMTAKGERVRLKACYCHSRHCEPCMRAKGNKIAANLRTRLGEQSAGRYRFLTLTLRHTKRPLDEQLKKLYASFRKLRGYREWKDSQWGGAAILEVKYDEKNGFWHPHLHLISEGNFLDKRSLSTLWRKASGDSYIVDIRSLKNEKEVAHYVTKYMAKGTSPGVWEIESVAQEWIIATKGVRSLHTYGTWRGFRLLQVAEDNLEWKPVCSLISLYAAIEKNEDWAMRLLKRLEEKRLSAEKNKAPPPRLIEN